MNKQVLIIIAFSFLSAVACKKQSMEATKWLVTGPDKELVEGLKQKAKRDSINRSPEQQEAIRNHKKEMARIEAERNAEIERLRADGSETAKYYDDEQNTSGGMKMSYNMGLVFVFIVLLGFAFLFWWTVIRKIRSRIRDLSYHQNSLQKKFNEAQNSPHFDSLNQEQREGLEKLQKMMNRMQ